MKPTFLHKNMMFIAGTVMVVLSLAFSTFSVVRVLSAPQAAPLPPSVTVPNKIGFEGYLAPQNGDIITGTHTLTFKLYTSADTNCIGTLSWTEAQSVTVNSGLYAVTLGDYTNLSPNLISDRTCIGVTLDSLGEMSPRTRISSVPFALNALGADQLDGLHAATSGDDAHVVASDSSGNVTASGGINVGSASGAGTGQINASGDISTTGNVYSHGRSVGDLTSDYEENLYLVPQPTNLLRAKVLDPLAPTILSINGTVVSTTTDITLTGQINGAAGLRYIFANISAGSTFTLSASITNTVTNNRRIAEIYWDGTNLNYASLFVYPPGKPSVYMARVRRAAVQSIGTSATAVSWDTEDVDNDSMYSSGTPTRVTILHPGLYLIVANANFANGTNNKSIYIKINGDSAKAYNGGGAPGGWDPYVNATAVVYLNTSDYVELYLRVNVSACNTAALTTMSVVALSP